MGYDFNDVDVSLGLNDEADITFNKFLQSLREKEVPRTLNENISDIINNVRKGEKYYSKTVFRKRIEEYTESEK